MTEKLELLKSKAIFINCKLDSLEIKRNEEDLKKLWEDFVSWTQDVQREEVDKEGVVYNQAQKITCRFLVLDPEVALTTH